MSDMNKEKRAEIIQDALDYLDDDMLESVDQLRRKAQGMEKQGKKPFFYRNRVLALAASVCLLVIGGYAWESFWESPLFNNENVPGGSMDADNLNQQEPEKAPGWVEDKLEADQPVADQETETIGENSQERVPEDLEKPGMPEIEEPIEPDHYPPMGDVYQLMNNYEKITMLPNKAWSSEANLQENFAKSRVIEAEYFEKMDKLIEAMCTTPRLETKMVLNSETIPEDTDIYHLFFQRSDGEIVQVCIFSDYGCVSFYEDRDFCMKIHGDLLYEVLKVLWTHW